MINNKIYNKIYNKIHNKIHNKIYSKFHYTTILYKNYKILQMNKY